MLAFLFAVQVQELYDAGKFEEALGVLANQPAENAAYYYNAGTLHYRLGHLGKAVAYLEKASQIRGGDPDIRANLDLARTSLGRTIGSDRLDPAASWIDATADLLPADLLRLGASLVGFILSLLWLGNYWKTRSLRDALLRPTALGALVILVTLGVGIGLKRSAGLSPAAAMLKPQTIRSGPGEHFLEIGRAEAGVKVRLLGPETKAEKDELWAQVRYSQTGIGWVRASTLLRL